jgi:hypothetical protein
LPRASSERKRSHIRCRACGSRPGRLVEHQHVGIVDERLRERQAPPHAAGQLADARVRLVLQLREFEQRRHECARGRRGDPEIAAEHEQVLADREVRIEIVELRHDADAPARMAGARRDRLAAERNGARVR